MTEYQACYRLEQNEVMLPMIFVSKKDAMDYVLETGLIGCWLHRESQSGNSDYRIAL